MGDREHLVDVERYYELIYLWAQVTNRFRAFARPGAYAIHRGLTDPVTGVWDTETIHRLIDAELPAEGEPSVLDAGCGYGGSVLSMAKSRGRWLGLTISKRQVAIARRNAERLGLAGRVAFRHGSFDDPLPERFDLVYGIESLIHSADPGRTVANLARSLRPGGRFVIVDDMPAADVAPRFAEDLARFKAYWRAPVMPTAAEWQVHLAAAGCRVVAERDLTDAMGPRSEAEIVAALDEVARKRRWRDRIGLRLVSDAQAGGLHLERLCSARAVRHVMIVAEKGSG